MIAKFQEQPSRCFLRKRCSENMPQIYRTTPVPSNFIEITLWHGCSPVNLLHIFRTPFSKNTPGWLLLNLCISLNHHHQSFYSFQRIRIYLYLHIRFFIRKSFFCLTLDFLNMMLENRLRFSYHFF